MIYAGDASVSEAAKNNPIVISAARAKLGRERFVGKRSPPVGVQICMHLQGVQGEEKCCEGGRMHLLDFTLTAR